MWASKRSVPTVGETLRALLSNTIKRLARRDFLLTILREAIDSIGRYLNGIVPLVTIPYGALPSCRFTQEEARAVC